MEQSLSPVQEAFVLSLALSVRSETDAKRYALGLPIVLPDSALLETYEAHLSDLSKDLALSGGEAEDQYLEAASRNPFFSLKVDRDARSKRFVPIGKTSYARAAYRAFVSDRSDQAVSMETLRTLYRSNKPFRERMARDMHCLLRGETLSVKARTPSGRKAYYAAVTKMAERYLLKVDGPYIDLCVRSAVFGQTHRERNGELRASQKMYDGLIRRRVREHYGIEAVRFFTSSGKHISAEQYHEMAQAFGSGFADFRVRKLPIYASTISWEQAARYDSLFTRDYAGLHDVVGKPTSDEFIDTSQDRPLDDSNHFEAPITERASKWGYVTSGGDVVYFGRMWNSSELGIDDDIDPTGRSRRKDQERLELGIGLVTLIASAVFPKHWLTHLDSFAVRRLAEKLLAARSKHARLNKASFYQRRQADTARRKALARKHQGARGMVRQLKLHREEDDTPSFEEFLALVSERKTRGVVFSKSQPQATTSVPRRSHVSTQASSPHPEMMRFWDELQARRAPIDRSKFKVIKVHRSEHGRRERHDPSRVPTASEAWTHPEVFATRAHLVDRYVSYGGGVSEHRGMTQPQRYEVRSAKEAAFNRLYSEVLNEIADYLTLEEAGALYCDCFRVKEDKSTYSVYFLAQALVSARRNVLKQEEAEVRRFAAADVAQTDLELAAEALGNSSPEDPRYADLLTDYCWLLEQRERRVTKLLTEQRKARMAEEHLQALRERHLETLANLEAAARNVRKAPKGLIATLSRMRRSTLLA